MLLLASSVLAAASSVQAQNAPTPLNKTISLDAFSSNTYFYPEDLATDTDGDSLSFTFSPGAGGTVTSPSPGIFYYTPNPASFTGTGIVNFTVSDKDGDAEGTLTLVDESSPYFGFIPHGRILVAGASGTATLPDLAAQVGVYDNAGVTSHSQEPPAGTTLAPGFHAVTFTASDAAGNEVTEDFFVQVMEKTKVIAAQGDVLQTGTGDARLLRFGVPAINDDGQVAYLARLSIPGERAVNAVVVSDTSSELQADIRAKTGEAAVGVENAAFAFFRDPVFDRFGNVAFIARVKGEAITNQNDYGVWFHDGEALQFVAHEGDEAAGIPGARFQRFVNIFLQDSQVMFVATLAQGDVIDKTNDVGVWAWDPNRGLRLVLREGDPVFTIEDTSEEEPAPKTLKFFSMLRSSSGSQGQGRNQFLNFDPLGPINGHFLWGKCTDGTKVLLAAFHLGDLEGSPQGFGPIGQIDVAAKLARTRTARDEVIPASLLLAFAQSRQPFGPDEGIIARNFGFPANNSYGEVVFSATLSGNPSAGVNRTNNAGIFVAGFSDPFALARKGDLLEKGAKWLSFKDPIINDYGDIAWLGTLDGVGVTKETNTAIWHVPFECGCGGSGEENEPLGYLVAREGFPAAGVPGAKWVQFTSIALPNGDPANGPIFLAKIAPDGTSEPPAQITAANDAGVWALDANDELTLLLREGDTLEINGSGKIVKSMTLLGPVSGSRGFSRSFNANGQVVVRVKFTDGTQALITLQASAAPSIDLG